MNKHMKLCCILLVVVSALLILMSGIVMFLNWRGANDISDEGTTWECLLDKEYDPEDINWNV